MAVMGRRAFGAFMGGMTRRVATCVAMARHAVLHRWQPAAARSEAGMATAEYAIATLAAVAFAGLLLVILGSDEVRGMLLSIIRETLGR